MTDVMNKGEPELWLSISPLMFTLTSLNPHFMLALV